MKEKKERKARLEAMDKRQFVVCGFFKESASLSSPLVARCPPPDRLSAHSSRCTDISLPFAFVQKAAIDHERASTRTRCILQRRNPSLAMRLPPQHRAPRRIQRKPARKMTRESETSPKEIACAVCYDIPDFYELLRSSFPLGVPPLGSTPDRASALPQRTARTRSVPHASRNGDPKTSLRGTTTTTTCDRPPRRAPSAESHVPLSSLSRGFFCRGRREEAYHPEVQSESEEEGVQVGHFAWLSPKAHVHDLTLFSFCPFRYWTTSLDRDG